MYFDGLRHLNTFFVGSEVINRAIKITDWHDQISDQFLFVEILQINRFVTNRCTNLRLSS